MAYDARVPLAGNVERQAASTSPSDAAINGAKEALGALSGAKTARDLANTLTNDTAAKFGYDILIGPLVGPVMMAGFDPKVANFLEQDPALLSDLTNLLKNVKASGATDPASALDAIKPYGREFFITVNGINDRLNRIIVANGHPSDNGPSVTFPSGMKFTVTSAPAFIAQYIPENFDAYTATVVAPDTVLLIPKVSTKITSSHRYEAVLDGGVWRIRMTTVEGSNTENQTQASNSSTEQPAQPVAAPPVVSGTPETGVLFDAINNLQLSEVKRTLTAHPNWVDARNHLNETPLIKAVSDGSAPIVSYLLTLRPDLTATDNNGATAADKAKSLGNQSIIKLLAKYNAP